MIYVQYKIEKCFHIVHIWVLQYKKECSYWTRNYEESPKDKSRWVQSEGENSHPLELMQKIGWLWGSSKPRSRRESVNKLRGVNRYLVEAHGWYGPPFLQHLCQAVGSRDVRTCFLFFWVLPTLSSNFSPSLMPWCPQPLCPLPIRKLSLCGTLHRDLWNLVSLLNMYFNFWNFQHQARNYGHNLEFTPPSGQRGCYWTSPVQGVLRYSSCAVCCIPLALLSALISGIMKCKLVLPLWFWNIWQT